jgi:dTMP kinase
MHLETEALLMFAARREHLAARIQPALAAGHGWCPTVSPTPPTPTRWGGLDEKRFAALEKWVHPHLQPDLTLIFDLDPQVAARRLAGAGQAPDRFESEQADFFERVRAAYLRRAAADPAESRSSTRLRHRMRFVKNLNKSF